MTYLKYIIIIFLLIYVKSNSATIRGTVTDSRTGGTLAGANVFILGTTLAATTDNKGFYIIDYLSTGKYIIKTYYIVYEPSIDTVYIIDNKECIELNIKLKSPIVALESVSNPQIEAYHKRISELNKSKPVLSIIIDSLVPNNGFLYAYISMSNNINDSFYVFKDYLCFNVIKPLITDRKGNVIKENLSLTDCVGEKTCPDTTDLLLIKPNETIKYPKTELKFYYFNKLPKENYSIKIQYEFKKPIEINTYYCYGNSSIKAIVKGLRGTYLSSNTITFNNK